MYLRIDGFTFFVCNPRAERRGWISTQNKNDQAYTMEEESGYLCIMSALVLDLHVQAACVACYNLEGVCAFVEAHAERIQAAAVRHSFK